MKRNVRVDVVMASLISAAAALAGCQSEALDPSASAADPTAEAVTETQGAATLAPRANAPVHFALELDGVMAGWLDSAAGGRATAEVLTVKSGTDNSVRKHLGNVKYEDITLTFGADMNASLYQWMQDVFDRKPTRRNGAIVAADYDFKELTRLTFYDGLITEIGLPAVDASSRDLARISLKVSPQLTKYVRQSSGGKLTPPEPARQRRWQARNFRLTVDGLDATGVLHVDPLVVKQPVIEFHDGSQREPRKEPGNLEIPNLVVTVSEATAESWYQWHEDFVILGNNSQDKEKNGSIEYLSPNLKDALFTLDFVGLGIFKLTPATASDTGNDTQPKEEAEMYCNDLRFHSKPKP